MGKIYETIDESIRTFIEAQPMYFVATAPLAGDGHINLSPKGLDSFRVLGPNAVAYLDLGGSGIETVAHAKENGRIVIMFCAFEGKPNIVRLHGKATAHERGTTGFDAHVGLFPELPGIRSVITVEVTRVADSCGWGVPKMEFKEQRKQLTAFAETLGPEKHAAALADYNAKSLDGLVGIGP